MTARLFLDLFAGTGGASAAFRNRPGWRVVAVDLVRGPGARDVVSDARARPFRLGPDVGRPVEVLRGAVPLALSEALRVAVDRARDLPALLDIRPFRRHRHVRLAGPLSDTDLFNVED